MNKKKFLKELEQKLELLNDSERKDIVNEYADHIDLEIKNGKTEEEAIKGFGKTDDLVEEILDAYKLNKDYKKPKSEFDKYLNKFLETVKDVFQNIMDSINEDTLGFIFRVIIALIAIGFLKIPFYIVKELGSGMLSVITFGFLDNFLTFLWTLLVQVGYILTSIFLLFSILKNKKVIENKSKEKEKKTKKATKAKEKGQEKKTQLEEKITEKIKIDNEIKKGIFIVFKVFAIIFCLPFVFALIGLAIGLGIFIKLAIEGVLLLGILFIILGTMFIISDIIRLIYNSMFNPKNVRVSIIIHLIIGFLFIGSGSVIMAFDIMKFDYIDEMPNHNYTLEQEEYEYTLKDSFDFEYNYGTYKIIKNESLEDTVIIKVSYIDELIQLKYNRITDNQVAFSIKEKDHYWNEVKDIYNLVIKDLKKEQIYNYAGLFLPKYEIYVNPDDVDKINIEKN